MRFLTVALYSALALVGGVVGGALFAPVPAQAQQTLRSENQILVPTDGLRFVTEQGRTVAVMGMRNGNGVLVMLDANGRQSATLAAHTGGSAMVAGTADGGLIEVGTADNTNRSRLSANASGTSFDSFAGSSLMLMSNNGSGGMLSLPGRNGAKGIEMLTGAGGGVLTVFSSGGKSALTAEGTQNGGMLSVRDAAGTTAATVSNAGIFASLKGSRVVWQGPPVSN